MFQARKYQHYFLHEWKVVMLNKCRLFLVVVLNKINLTPLLKNTRMEETVKVKRLDSVNLGSSTLTP